jgi:DNA-binding GntR family transcriptional regulator
VTIDPLGEVPVYQQLCQILRNRIASGELAVGRPIPSLVTLQQQYGVARGTAAKSLAILVDEGLVRIVPGKGAYVIARPRR